MEQKSKMMPPPLTRRKMRKLKAISCSTSGKEKGGGCFATGLDKAMAKYPRNKKTEEYIDFLIKKQNLRIAKGQTNRYNFI